MLGFVLLLALAAHTFELLMLTLLPFYFVPSIVALIIAYQLVKRLDDGEGDEGSQSEMEPSVARAFFFTGLILSVLVAILFTYLTLLVIPDQFLSDLFFETELMQENDDLRMWGNRMIIFGYWLLVAPIGLGALFMQIQKVPYLTEKFENQDFVSLARGSLRSIWTLTPLFIILILLQFMSRTWQILIP